MSVGEVKYDFCFCKFCFNLDEESGRVSPYLFLADFRLSGGLCRMVGLDR